MPEPGAAGPRRRRAALARCTAGLLVAALLAGCGVLDEQQRAWIFQPSDRVWAGGLAAAEGLDDVWIDYRSSAGAPVRLHGLWLPAARADAPVLLYLHGARWDVRGSAPRLRRLQSLGFAVLGIDYRGFGRSSPGLPSEAMAVEDAAAAWAWLAQQHPGRPRYLFGHSLGGAIAVALAAAQPDVAGLMVEGSFTSLPEVVRSFRWGWLPLEPLITQRFDAAGRIGQVRAPVLVVHGSDDALIPPALGRALFEQARPPKRFVQVAGGNHHSTLAVGLDQYRLALAELFGLPAAAMAAR